VKNTFLSRRGFHCIVLQYLKACRETPLLKSGINCNAASFAISTAAVK
jgi:hypothetical protein